MDILAEAFVIEKYLFTNHIIFCKTTHESRFKAMDEVLDFSVGLKCLGG